MGQTDELNHPMPPKILERLVGLAVPSTSREHVLGDLHERYVSPLSYLADAASAVPAAVLGSIRRSMPLAFVPLEFLLIYASILLAGVWANTWLWLDLRCLGPHYTWGQIPISFTKSAAAAAYVTIALVGRDAYRRNPLSQPFDKNEAAPWFQLPPYTTEYYTRQAWPKAYPRVKIAVEVDLVVFLALYSAQAALPTRSVFPEQTTTTLAVFVVAVLLSPLRVWLGTRLPRPERRP